ncbi:MAG: hypothetical protein GC186_01330 [Rhodobacteraceae bacterium]|nr:hypothetical protein [Paracoccaceae bacterium]
MVLFGGRAVYLAIYWSDPAHVAQTLEPWMTPRYVARSYQVDLHGLTAALGLAVKPGDRPTLEALARHEGLSFADYAAKVRQAIDTVRAAPHG